MLSHNDKINDTNSDSSESTQQDNNENHSKNSLIKHDYLNTRNNTNQECTFTNTGNNNGDGCNIDCKLQKHHKIVKNAHSYDNTGINKMHVSSNPIDNNIVGKLAEKFSVSLDHNYSVNNVKYVKIGFLNICNLTTRLKIPEFKQFVKAHDIFGCAETKIDCFDNVDICGYKCLKPNLDLKTDGRRSGGVCLYMKSNIFKEFKVVECVKHCKICEQICNDSNHIWCIVGNLLLGILYVPPESSVYSDPELFDKICHCILDLNNHFNFESICLLGDFNARSGSLDDSVEIDHNIKEHNFLPDISEQFLHIPNYNVSPNRMSEDDKCNNYGYSLIDLCCNLNLNIVNGRFGIESGKLTCKNASVVDYCIASPVVFLNITKFTIREFDHLLSDVHSPLYLELHPSALSVDDNNITKEDLDTSDSMNENNTTLSTSTNQSITDDNLEECGRFRFRWDQDKASNFIQSINENDVKIINEKLDTMLLNDNKPEKVQVNELTTDISNLLKESAKRCNMLKTKRSHDQIEHSDKNAEELHKDNRWFNTECLLSRKRYHKAKNKYRKMKTLGNLNKVKQASKNYKKTINQAFDLYKKRFNKKLRSLKCSDPKQYWKILCCNESKSIANKIQLEVMTEYFEKLNTDTNQYSEYDLELSKSNGYNDNEIINCPITVEEVCDIIIKLKNNKSAGIDLIINEFMKCAKDIIAPLLTKLFNIILNSGVIPDEWTKSLIVPIYKMKGSEADPSNYRGISLLSCMSKVFSALISNRLSRFCENFDILGSEQAGFRKGYSTTDHIFVLNCLFELYSKKLNKKLFCCFVDYKKAFDKVPRVLLWNKLLSYNINGKMLNVIRSLYNEAKSAIKLNNDIGSFFACDIGVRQGDNLSPLLFALYLNDLQTFLSKGYNGLTSFSKSVEELLQDNDIVIYIKLYAMLYADDTIIFAESKHELQAALNSMLHYCQIWKLEVNADKTKIVIFGNRKNLKEKTEFRLGDKPIEVVSEYPYLGISFQSNGVNDKSLSHLRKQASKAMFSMLRRARKLNLDIDIQLKLFDSLVTPIVLYGCEVWGFKNVKILETLHRQFCKILLRVNRSRCLGS